MKKRLKSSGYTLIEILIALAAALVLIAGVYSFVFSTNVLTSKIYSITSTGTEARNTLDTLQGFLQTTYTAPVPIDTTGAALSSNLSISGTAAVASGLAAVVSGSGSAVITGTGPGIKLYRYVGGPYIPTIPTGGLPGTATSITIVLDTSALPTPPVPQANDVLVINTTALQGASGFQAWATIGGTPSLVSTSGSKVTYSVPLTAPMKTPPTTSSGTTSQTNITSIAYQTDNLGTGVVSYSASLLRPTAFIIVTNGANKELRMFDGYATDSSGKVVLSGTNYTTLTNAIDTGTTTLSQFGVVTMGGKTFASLVLRVRSTDYDNYLANRQNDGFCTYMGFNSFIALKSTP